MINWGDNGNNDVQITFLPQKHTNGVERKAVTMKKINYRVIEKMPITIEVMNMVSVLHEYKGRQELYIETQPEILNKLMEVARMQRTRQ